MAPKKKVEEKPKIRWGRPGNTLKMGLVGLPNVGKSTTFNVLTKCNVPAENFPFCTIDPSEAVVSVPDARFDHLCKAFKPKSEVAAVLKIWDIAGLVPNAHQGDGLGNAFLSHIGAVDGIYHVCRAFAGEEDNIVHTEGDVDPARDLKIIRHELLMKDLERLEKLCTEWTRKVAQNQKLKEIKDECDALHKVKDMLTEGKYIRDVEDWTAKEQSYLNKYQFLTTKPACYLVNLSEKDFIRKKNKFLKPIFEWVQANGGGPIVPYSAEFEQRLVEMESDAEREAYMKDVGAQSSMLDRIIKTGYEQMELCHFFTCGEDEVRAWTVQQGSKAPQAAGVIHTDMERGFICLEVFKYQDLEANEWSEDKVKAAGKKQQKGKEYVVEDGDICFVKFNVTTSAKK